MLTWTGQLTKGTATWYYNVYYWDPYSPWSNRVPQHPGFGPLCHTDSMWRKFIHYHDPIATWGYYGDGTKQLAVAMLGWTLCNFQADVYSRAVDDHWSGELIRQTIKKHHVAFAREVLANLPDNWTMTELDILEWLNKRERRLFKKHRS